MRFKSLSDLSVDIQVKLLPQLPRDVGVVYGIPRSGMIPATIIATAIGAKLGTLGGASYFGSRQKHRVLPTGAKVLLVDDSSHTGKAMAAASAALRRERVDHYTCAVYAHTNSSSRLDFYAEVLDDGRIFQWNFTGVKATERFCWDMDGVICTNPTVFDDDGDGYRNHILNEVRPLYLPQVMVKAIVTNRLERWRSETETWLHRYGVQYRELLMQPYPTAAERRQKSRAEEFKVRHFIERDGSIFIESHDRQAQTIAALSRRPVLSVESMQLFGGERVETPL